MANSIHKCCIVHLTRCHVAVGLPTICLHANHPKLRPWFQRVYHGWSKPPLLPPFCVDLFDCYRTIWTLECLIWFLVSNAFPQDQYCLVLYVLYNWIWPESFRYLNQPPNHVHSRRLHWSWFWIFTTFRLFISKPFGPNALIIVQKLLSRILCSSGLSWLIYTPAVFRFFKCGFYFAPVPTPYWFHYRSSCPALTFLPLNSPCLSTIFFSA